VVSSLSEESSFVSSGENAVSITRRPPKAVTIREICLKLVRSGDASINEMRFWFTPKRRPTSVWLRRANRLNVLRTEASCVGVETIYADCS